MWIHILRHAHTEDDNSISDAGRAQSKRVAQKIKAHFGDDLDPKRVKIITSDQARAYQTGLLIGAEIGIARGTRPSTDDKLYDETVIQKSLAPWLVATHITGQYHQLLIVVTHLEHVRLLPTLICSELKIAGRGDYVPANPSYCTGLLLDTKSGSQTYIAP